MRHFALLAVSFTAAALQAADPALLNLVMPDAKVLAGINVQKAKTTQFGQFLLTKMPVGDEVHGFMAATGFDPRQDLMEVLVASGTESKSGLVIARGTFNPAQISAAIDKDGKHSAQTYNGAQLITSNTKSDQGAIAFLASGIAVAGDLVSVKGAIDRSTANNAIDPGLAAKVASYAAADVWSVSMAPLNMPNDGSNPFAGALKSIQQASGSIVLSSPVEISAEALADNDQDATSLSDVLKFVVSMMQSQGQGQGDGPAALLNSLNVTTDHSTINLKLSNPEDQLEQLIKGMHDGAEKSAKKRVAAHV
jgi:hypothetical protein